MKLISRIVLGGALLCSLIMQNSNALEANTAVIKMAGSINDDNVIRMTVNNGKGCSAGQLWDIGTGGCTSPVLLRSENTTRSCSCTCPEAGSCTSQQSGSYPVYGWRTPPSGEEVISGYGSTSWGSCQVVSNSCKANPGPPPPSSGQTFVVDAFICNSSHPSYGSGPLGSGEKNQIIGTYRNFNYGQRCPEQGGYVYWQGEWASAANQYQQSNPAASRSLALSITWPQVRDNMNAAASQNGEQNPSYASTLNRICTDYAYQVYGMNVSASYISGSGSSCRVN